MTVEMELQISGPCRSGGWRGKINVALILCPARTFFLAVGSAFLLCPYMEERERPLASSPLRRALIPSWDYSDDLT